MPGKSTRNEKLAIDGGPSVRKKGFPARFLFGKAEKQAAMALFDQAMVEGSHVLGYHGPQEEGYCKAFAKLLGGGFADGVNSGTSAVYVALRALELEPFTEVIVPAISDPGGVMPVVLANCIPVPADCAPDSYNVGAEQIARRLNKRTSAIIVAHIAGLPCDMGPIMKLARSRGIPVIEDCAQSHCGKYKGRPLGTIGDVSAFSTMFGKHHASAGQGGIVFTKSRRMYWRIRRYADRGKPFGLKGANGNVAASLNLNMDELHAAVGRVQVKKLPGIVRRRRRLAKSIAAGCRRYLKAISMTEELPGCEGVYWFLFFKVRLDMLKVDKATLVSALAYEGIPVSASYWACPTRQNWCVNRSVFGTSRMPWSSPSYKGNPDRKYALPNIEATDASHFRMSLHEGWTATEVSDVLAALRKVEKAYLK